MLQSKRRKEAISEVSSELGISEQEVERLAAKLASNERFVEQFLRKLDFRIARRVMLAMVGGGLLGALIPKSLAAGGGVICDFVEAEKQRFYPAAVGPYSAIINQEENYVWAEDCYGKTIEDGESEDAGEVIQAGVDYVYSKGGGVVWIREGEYSIGAEITLKPLVNLIGAGREVTKLKLAYNGDMFTAPSDARLNSQRIAHMTLDGDKANRSAGSAFNVYAYRTFFEDLVIKNFPENGLVLKGVNWQGDNTIRDCFILNNGNIGVKLDSQVSDCTLYNVWIGNNSLGLEAHVIFEANTIHVYGGQVSGSIGMKLYNSALIVNSYFEKFGKQAIIVDSSERWTGNINLIGCWVKSASMDANNTHDSILLDATGGNPIRQVKIIGCIFNATETNKPRYHIRENGDVDKTIISLCSFANHQTGAYSTVGANDVIANNVT